MLLHHSFPSLHTLILSDCELDSEDLASLARARTKRSLKASGYFYEQTMRGPFRQSLR